MGNVKALILQVCLINGDDRGRCEASCEEGAGAMEERCDGRRESRSRGFGRRLHFRNIHAPVPASPKHADTTEINLKKWLVEADESLSSPHKCGNPETHHPCNYPTAETP